jgi:NACalpha-BTF3-like transcription factor
MRGQQEKEGQFKDAVEEVVDEKTGQVIKRPVIYSANTGQQAQQGQSQAQQSFKTADEVETARKAGKVKSGDVVIINGRPARIN